jgi:hypothetical protein
MRLRSVVAIVMVLTVGFAAITLAALEGNEVVVVRTHEVDGGMRETRVWVAEQNGALWVEAATPEREFYRDLLLQPTAELVRGQSTLRVIAHPEPGPAGHQRIRALLAAKYGWAAVPPGTRTSLYNNPKYQQAAKAFAGITQESINSADPEHPTLNPVPYTGIQYVVIPQFESLGLTVGQQVANSTIHIALLDTTNHIAGEILASAKGIVAATAAAAAATVADRQMFGSARELVERSCGLAGDCSAMSGDF